MGLTGSPKHVDYMCGSSLFYRAYISNACPKPVKLPEIKRWVIEWIEEFEKPPKEVRLNPTIVNQRTIDQLHELGVMIIKSIGGVPVWEVHLGPAVVDPPPM